MPMTLARWQRYGRGKWMRSMKVRDSRIVYEQRFVFLPRIATAVTREYVLSDGKIFYEQYVFWQADGATDVVMLEMQEVQPYRYAYPPRW